MATATASTTPAIICINIFFLILSLQQVSCTFQVPINRLKNSDLQKFRIPRASKLLSYMNDSVDPCFDFYEFACGNWHTQYPASEEAPITSPMVDLEDTVNKEVHVLLEEIGKRSSEVDRRIKNFYLSCLDSEGASQTVKQVFSNFASNNSGMPAVDENWDEKRYDWLTQISDLRMNYGMDILIGLEIKPDWQSRQDNRIYIGEPSTLIPKSVCKEADVKNSVYEELQREIEENMVFWFDIDKSEATKFAQELLDFETNLCRGMTDEEASNNDDGSDGSQNVSRMTLNELNNLIPSINFYIFVTSTLKQPFSLPVYLQHKVYFDHLPKIIRSTSKQVIANYIMYRALATISFSEESDPEKRASLCTELCMQHFPRALGEMFNKRNTFSDKVEDVRQLWNNLKEALKDDVGSQAWMDENTRKQLIYKVAQIQMRFPQYEKDLIYKEYGHLKIDKSQFWQNIMNVLELEQRNEIKKLYNSGDSKDSGQEQVESFDIEVGYNSGSQLIQIPLGLLQSPVYHRTAPFSYKYGVLGFFVVREIIRGFDENIWNAADDSTSLVRMEENTTLAYKERSKCFREQYVSYVGENSGLSSGELDEKIQDVLAGNGALNVSFNAYLKWLEDTDEPHILYDETLSEVDYTNTQLFFIAFAQNFCTSRFTKEEPTGFFPWDVSNYLDKYEVNGLLWNMREFSREFNCLPGTEMNPGDKCEIY